MGDGVTLIDSGYETALEVKRTLDRLNLARENRRDRVEYYVTSRPEEFDKVANIFLGEGNEEKAILTDIKD